MNNGKRICRILKDIRKRIAEENDIDFIVSECTYRGNCAGTCPKCEAEVQYLCEQLDVRRQMGKAVMLTGLSMGMLASSVAMSSCNQSNGDKNEISIEEIGQSVLLGEVIPDSIAEELKDSVIETKKVEKELNSIKVTELLIAGNPNPVIKGVYDLPAKDGPKFPGGDDALNAYVSRELGKIDFKNHLDFSIEAWLVIGADGKVKSIHKRGYSCASSYWDKVDSVLMNLPAFTPGMYKGKAVDSWYLAYGRWKTKVKAEKEIKDSTEIVLVDTLSKENEIQ